MFGRAAVTLGIGHNSSFGRLFSAFTAYPLLVSNRRHGECHLFLQLCESWQNFSYTPVCSNMLNDDELMTR